MITHIAGMGRNGAHSILGGNLRYLDSKYSLDCKQIVSKWRFPAQFHNLVTQFNDNIIQIHDSCDRQCKLSFEFIFVHSNSVFLQQAIQKSHVNM